MQKPNNEPLHLPHVIDSQIVFEESLLKIQRDRLQIDRNPPYIYYTLLSPPFAVAILPFTPNGEYVLIEEYRHPTHHIILGCPAGYIDHGEDPIKAAQRELLEETGFQAKSFRIIGSAYPYTGFSGQQTIYIEALESTFVKEPRHEPSEIIRTRILSPEILNEIIDSGTSLDGTLCTALYFHQRKTK